MLLRNKGSQETYHVPTGVGKAMIHAGFAEEVVPPVTKPVPNTTWAVRDGARVEDFVYPPVIYAKCSHCGKSEWQSSQKGTAHLTMRYRHLAGCAGVVIPGVPEQVPDHIAQEYMKRWTAYQSLSRNRKAPALTSMNSAERDRRLMKAAGYKTREELILEAVKLAPAKKE